MKFSDFFNYQRKALTRHGVHSPLIYDLQDNVFLDKCRYPVYAESIAILDKLLRDNTELTLTDLGAGSKKPAKVKTVSRIAKQATQRRKYRELLFRIVKHYGSKTVLELGTSLGVTSNYLFAGLIAEAKLYTIEGDPAVFKLAAEKVLPKSDRLQHLLGSFDEVLPGLLKEVGQFDLVYIDGNHTYEATIRYFNWLIPHLSKDAILIFDDIYWSEGMKKAWQEIVADPRSQYTADLFKLGLVFFTPARVKQHFVLRY